MSLYTNPRAPVKFSIFSGIFITILMFSACGSITEKLTTSNSTANSNNVNTTKPIDGNNSKTTEIATTPPPIIPNSSSGKCSNQYYPLLPDEKRKYKITGAGPAEYTLVQKDITDSGFKEQRDFKSGTSVIVNWICTDDGLRMAEYKNDILFKQGTAEMETLESSGISIPKIWETGKEFESEYKVKVKISIGSIKANADGKITIKSKVEALNEVITVGGKSYETARLNSKISISITMKGKTMQGATANLTNWFSPEKGLIKQENTGTLGTNTLELVGNE